MALVTGPNGKVTEVPDSIAACLVGVGDRGFAYAETPVTEPVTKHAPKKRAHRKPTKEV